MKKTFCTILIIIIYNQIFGQSGSTNDKIVRIEEFKNFIDTIGLVFEMPAGYNPSNVISNRDLDYSFAIINQDSSMQIRYSIFPIKSRMIEYEKSLNDPNTIMINPNKLYPSLMQANMLNMTGGMTYNIGSFPKEAVKEEFNADDGGSCFFEFNCGFGKGYKYGHFVYLHKDNVADVIITYMDNDKQKHNALMDAPFHSLRFKK